MNILLPRCLRPRLKTSSARRAAVFSAAAMLLLGMSHDASAQLVFFDFSDSAQYNDNFTEYRAPDNIAWSANNGVGGEPGYVFANTSSNNPNLRYDGSNAFLTETISADYWVSGMPGAANGPAHFSIVTRMQNTTGVMGLIRFSTTTSIDLRLYYGANLSDGSLGTNFYDATFDLSTGDISHATGTGGTGSSNAVPTSSWNENSVWNTINPMTLTFEQTAGDDPSFKLTLTDAQGFVASTDWQVLTETDAYNNPGYVGTRLSSGSNLRHGIDNFTIIPEPSTWAMAVSGFALSAVFLRRRRTRK